MAVPIVGRRPTKAMTGQEVDLLVGEHQLVEFADILEEVGVIATEVAGAELSRK